VMVAAGPQAPSPLETEAGFSPVGAELAQPSALPDYGAAFRDLDVSLGVQAARQPQSGSVLRGEIHGVRDAVNAAVVALTTVTATENLGQRREHMCRSRAGRIALYAGAAILTTAAFVGNAGKVYAEVKHGVSLDTGSNPDVSYSPVDLLGSEYSDSSSENAADSDNDTHTHVKAKKDDEFEPWPVPDTENTAKTRLNPTPDATPSLIDYEERGRRARENGQAVGEMSLAGLAALGVLTVGALIARKAYFNARRGPAPPDQSRPALSGYAPADDPPTGVMADEATRRPRDEDSA
jgi:hypothetical protein